MKKTPIIAGNWKMNTLPSDGTHLINDVTKLLFDIKSVRIIFAPPFTGLFGINLNPPFHIAAQNCHWKEFGAYTGEISIDMLKELGVEYVIVGHSERRHVFYEKDHWINNKVKSLIRNEISPILCIGETIEQRKKGQTEDILKEQLKKGLQSVNDVSMCIIAYEPVWSIGTGLAAEAEQIEIAHEIIRTYIFEYYDGSDDLYILYGGSVDSNNAEKLISINGVDGFLIGGASLKANSFASIIRTVSMVKENK